jgi:pimeloyl-ACP methyl ester carboxylesterase
LERSADHLQNLLAELTEVERIHVVTHSLGGLVLRETLARSAVRSERIASVSMCFPPNQGADLADLLAVQPLARLVLGPSLERLTHAAATTLPPWKDIPLQIIAGEAGRNPLIEGANDWVVSTADTKLAAIEPIRLPITHTFGVNDKHLHAQVITWLQAHSLR